MESATYNSCGNRRTQNTARGLESQLTTRNFRLRIRISGAHRRAATARLVHTVSAGARDPPPVAACSVWTTVPLRSSLGRALTQQAHRPPVFLRPVDRSSTGVAQLPASPLAPPRPPVDCSFLLPRLVFLCRMSLSSSGVPSDDPGEHPVDYLGFERHEVAWIIGGFFAVIATGISFATMCEWERTRQAGGS